VVHHRGGRRGVGGVVGTTVIERLFTAILRAAFGILGELVRGIFGAPATAVRKLTEPVDIAPASTADVIDLRHQVLRAGLPRDTAHFDGDNESTTRHWVARRADQIVGIVTVVARPFPDGDGPAWQLRGMAVHPSHQRVGIGAALLRVVEDAVAEPMWCNARTTAQRFYASHGWQAVGDTFDIPTAGPHVRMVRRRD
jgi:GNAT superfamily N-acetyltransferase